MANTLRSTPAHAHSSVFPSRRVGSQPPTGIAPVCLWLLSQRPRLGRGAPRLSTGPSAARSRRWSLPTSWLAGLLLLTLSAWPGRVYSTARVGLGRLRPAAGRRAWIVRRGPTARRDGPGGDRPAGTLRDRSRPHRAPAAAARTRPNGLAPANRPRGSPRPDGSSGNGGSAHGPPGRARTQPHTRNYHPAKEHKCRRSSSKPTNPTATPAA